MGYPCTHHLLAAAHRSLADREQKGAARPAALAFLALVVFSIQNGSSLITHFGSGMDLVPEGLPATTANEPRSWDFPVRQRMACRWRRKALVGPTTTLITTIDVLDVLDGAVLAVLVATVPRAADLLWHGEGESASRGTPLLEAGRRPNLNRSRPGRATRETLFGHSMSRYGI